MAARPQGREDRTSVAMIWLLVEKIPWFAMVLGDGYITVYGQNKGVALNSFEGLPMGVRLLNAVESCGEYLRQTVWPTGLAPFYAHPAHDSRRLDKGILSQIRHLCRAAGGDYVGRHLVLSAAALSGRRLVLVSWAR